MKLSVVIPVYKVQYTLVECVESVLRQNIPSMEIILVDDGSPDECPMICDRLASENECITVIHKKNGGLSSARNAGIEIAKGEYITFVDSDDFLKDGTYQEILAILEEHKEYDILEFPLFKYYNSRRQFILTFDNKTYDNAADYWLKGHAYGHSYAWNKFYKRHLFDEVRYPEGLVFEDVYTLPLLLNKAKCVATCDRGLYYYRANKNGITGQAGGKEWKMLLDANIHAFDNIKFTQHDEDFLRYYMHLVNIQIQVYEAFTHKISLPKIKIGREIFQYLRNKEVPRMFKFKCIIIKITNLKTLCRLISMFQKKRENL